MRPAEHEELQAIEGLDEGADESDEAAAVHCIGNDAVVFEEEVQRDVLLEHTAEVLVDRLPVEVVVGAEEKVPRDRAEPRKLVVAVHHVPDCDDLK